MQISRKSEGCKACPKPGTTDTSQVKSFRSIRPSRLLPVLGKALETLIIMDILKETRLDTLDEQHGFTTGKSTISAIEEVYRSIDESKSRHVFGTFVDITGAFDNVKLSLMFYQLANLGASLGTVRIVHSYLTNRWVNFELEGVCYSKKLKRGCPQCLQLGPRLWKVAISPIYNQDMRVQRAKIIAYADDILLMIGVARSKTAFLRIERQLDLFNA